MITAGAIILVVVLGSIWCFLALQPRAGDVEQLRHFNRQVLLVVGLLYLLMLGAFWVRLDDSESVIGVALVSALLFVPFCLAFAGVYRSRSLSHPRSNGRSSV